jgi:hypothetical protein
MYVRKGRVSTHDGINLGNGVVQLEFLNLPMHLRSQGGVGLSHFSRQCIATVQRHWLALMVAKTGMLVRSRQGKHKRPTLESGEEMRHLITSSRHALQDGQATGGCDAKVLCQPV